MAIELPCPRITLLTVFYFQLFKRRNVATAEEETEEEVMSDGGFHEAQINNMEMAPVSKIMKGTLISVSLMKIPGLDLFLCF